MVGPNQSGCWVKQLQRDFAQDWRRLFDNDIDPSWFCVFYTSKCFAAEIQFKKAIFMIHFRQLLARSNSSFIEIFMENMRYWSIDSSFRIRKHSSVEIIGMRRHIHWLEFTENYYCSLQLLVWSKYYHVTLNQTKKLSWDAIIITCYILAEKHLSFWFFANKIRIQFLFS